MRSRQGHISGLSRPWQVTTALAVLTFAFIAALPQASAQDVEVELGIVFSDEQGCADGSDKLVSAAFPFDVEACFSQGGSPLAGHDVYFEINHGDGAIERIDGVTDTNGVVRSTITPTSAGATTVAACDAAGCHASVELESDSDPPPPVTPYAPTGNDLGPSAALTDAPLDMIDPFSGGAAGPEESSRHGGVDISSLAYAGLVEAEPPSRSAQSTTANVSSRAVRPGGTCRSESPLPTAPNTTSSSATTMASSWRSPETASTTSAPARM